jgi:flagellar basal body rod protein FlgG
LENESCDVFSNQVLMEEEPLTKMMEQNRSLQIQSNIINKDEKMMKLNLYV